VPHVSCAAVRTQARLALGTLGILLLAACNALASAELSASASAAPIGGLPPGCHAIDLRGPSGARIVLDGRWLEDAADARMTWWIRTQGDCVWGAGHIEDISPEGSFDARPDQVQSLAGHVGSAFVITGEIIWLAALPPGTTGTPSWYSPLRMLIEIDDAGEITLREDREPGVTGPRCPDPSGFCPAPLVLRPAE
jgi:hypothetical protein